MSLGGSFAVTNIYSAYILGADATLLTTWGTSRNVIEQILFSPKDLSII